MSRGLISGLGVVLDDSVVVDTMKRDTWCCILSYWWVGRDIPWTPWTAITLDSARTLLSSFLPEDFIISSTFSILIFHNFLLIIFLQKYLFNNFCSIFYSNAVSSIIFLRNFFFFWVFYEVFLLVFSSSYF